MTVEGDGYDGNGWARGAVLAWPAGRAWTLLSPEAEGRMDAARWSHQAATFFNAELRLPRAKSYPAGTLPIADRATVEIAWKGARATRVEVVTLPIDRAPELLAAGFAGARAIGGAGFDAILPRTRRVWQVAASVTGDGDPRASLAVAAVLASVFLAPIVPPEGGVIFGVKGARERLARRPSG